MTAQPELDFRATRSGWTQDRRLTVIFLGRPNQWLPMPWLGEQIGAWAVHSRVADLRKAGMHIEHRSHVNPISGQRESFYRYTPNQNPQ